VGDVDADDFKHTDGDDRDQREDQGVLNERLTFLGLKLRQLNPRCESLNHLRLSFLPSKGLLVHPWFTRSQEPGAPAKGGGRPPLRRKRSDYQTNFGPTALRRIESTSQKGSDQSMKVPRIRRAFSCRTVV